MERDAIERRLALVQWFQDDSNLRGNMRGALKALPDIGRELGRIAIGRGSPRDLGQLRDGLNEARLLRERKGRLPDMTALMAELRHLLEGLGAVNDLLSPRRAESRVGQKVFDPDRSR